MTLKEIAKLIPAVERREILKQGMISSAQPTTANATMLYLAKLWKKHIDYNIEVDCNFCMQTVLNNYTQIAAELVELERQSVLLESL